MLGNAYLGQDHPNNSAIPDTIVMGVLIIISQIVEAGLAPGSDITPSGSVANRCC